ncbi:MAG TPA: putative baseplate assembly protein, partial [Sorangium sp.]|nr:putative baseplate assembly protein [Sorangium sp.]
RIPVYNPEWTDHNPSDPGITLIELVAFLGENLLYRFNQIPETTRLAFLKLLGAPLRPAAAARALVAIADPKPVVGEPPPIVPLGAAVKAGAVPFELETEVTVAPFRPVVVARMKLARELDPEEEDFASATILALGGLGQGEAPEYYRNVVVPDDPAKPDAQPVDLGKTVDQIVWIAALGDPASIHDLAGRTLNVGFVPDETIASIADALDPCPGAAGFAPRRDPCLPADARDTGDGAREVVWEISTGARDEKTKAPIYRALAVRGDTTRGLRQRGVVRLGIPLDTAAVGTFDEPDPDLRGTGMLPPVLDDPKEDAQVAFWLRAYYRDGRHRLGRVLWVGLNAAEASQQTKASAELLGTGTGQASQRYRLVHRPVIKGSLVVEVEEQPGQWARWSEVDGLEASREDDRHYVVDLEAGEVQLGNGVQGFAPQIGQRIRATEYRHGGGPEGNVPAKTLSRIEVDAGLVPPGASRQRLAALKATNPLPARGGAPAESLAAALERLPGELRRHDRAVTASDFRELALATPGADVIRAECIPLFEPGAIGARAAGAVTVVIWPREDPKRPGAPMPDRTTLRAVCEYLDQRRLITTELYVVPPTYVPVVVSIGNLRVKPGHGVDSVRSWVELVVRQYLAPVPPYGPDGRGWPLGRSVYAPEIEAVALQVEGVEYIDDGGVVVARRDAAGAWVKGRLDLRPHEVPELVGITVVTDAPLEPGAGYVPPVAAGEPPKLIPIPIIPEEC